MKYSDIFPRLETPAITNTICFVKSKKKKAPEKKTVSTDFFPYFFAGLGWGAIAETVSDPKTHPKIRKIQ